MGFSVVGLAHATSHFFQLLLPPLFPWLAAEFTLSFAQLGSLASLFYLVSALGQAAAGFVVDKVGARAVMFAGLLLFAVTDRSAIDDGIGIGFPLCYCWVINKEIAMFVIIAGWILGALIGLMLGGRNH